MTEKNDTETTNTTPQGEQTPITPTPPPPKPTEFKVPSGELRENVNRGETKQVDTRTDTDK
jgi:hypothetical protein